MFQAEYSCGQAGTIRIRPRYALQRGKTPYAQGGRRREGSQGRWIIGEFHGGGSNRSPPRVIAFGGGRYEFSPLPLGEVVPRSGAGEGGDANTMGCAGGTSLTRRFAPTSPPGRGENSRPRTPNAITLALLRETPRKHRETPQKPTVVAPASAGRPPARPVRNPRMSEHGSSGRDVRGAIGGKTPCAQRKPPPHRSASIANSAYAPEGRSAPTAGYAARPHTPREANPTCDDQ